MKELKTSQGTIVFVDDEDYDRLSIFKWGATKRLSIQRFYRVPRKSLGIRGYTVAISLSSEIMKTTGIKYDHKDRNPLNFSKENLRVCTYLQNAHNRKAVMGKSRFKGVCVEAHSGKWIARITFNGKRYSLGHFILEEDAARAYDKMAKKLYKEFAVLNFME